MENQFLRSYNLLSTSIAGANNIQQLPPTAIPNAFSSSTMSPLQQLLTAAFAAAAAAATANVTTTNFDSILPVMALPCSATDQHKMQPARPLLGEDSNVPQEKLDNDANFSPQDFFHKKTFNERNFRTAPNNTLAYDGGQESMPLQQTLRTTSSNSSNGSSCGGFAGNCNSINKASCPLENCRQMLALFAPPPPPPLPHFAVDRLPTSQPSLNATSNGIKFSIDRILRSSHGQPQTVGSENNRFFPFRPPSINNNFGQFSSSVNDVMTERNKASKPYSSNFVKLEQQPASGNEFQDNEPSHHTNNNGKRLRNKSDSEENETKAKAACRRRSVGKFVDGDCEKKTPKCEPLLPNENTIWPAWVYCTRYSDRPSSVGKTGPRIRKQRNNTKKKSSLAADTAKIAMTNDGDCDGAAAAAGDDKRPRTAFTQHQLDRLKTEFHVHRYLTEQKRQQLAGELNLNESQIKIWFQNKRAKLKKATGVKNKLAQQLISQGLYNHSTMSLPMTDDDDDDDEDLDCKAEVQQEIQVDDGVRTGSSNIIFGPSENSA